MDLDTHTSVDSNTGTYTETTTDKTTKITTVDTPALSGEDFAAKVLADNYANPIPGYIIGNGRNPEIAIDNFYDAHAAVVAKYGQEVYEAAVQACVASQYADGRKAEHVENHAQRLTVDATAAQDADDDAVYDYEMRDGVAVLVKSGGAK